MSLAIPPASAADAPDSVGLPVHSRDLLTKMAQQVPGVLFQFVLHADGRIEIPFSSETVHDVFGVSPRALRELAPHAFRYVHAEDLPRVREAMVQSARDLTPWGIDYRVKLPEVGVRWVRMDARPERCAEGRTCWFGFVADTTDRQHAQQALAESEALLRFQIDNAPEAIMVLDAETGRYVDVNRNAERLLGRSREALIALSPLELTAPQQANGLSAEDFLAVSIQCAKGGEPAVFEWNAVHGDGHLVFCELRVVRLPVAGRVLLRGSITDIGERVQARQALMQLQAAIDSSLNGVAIADRTGALTYVNRAFLDLWKYEQEEDVLGRSALSFWRSREEAQVVVTSLATAGAWTGELTAMRHDGSVRTMMLNASAIVNAAGEMTGMLASFADITDTKRLEVELNQSQKLDSIGRLAGGVAHDFNNLLTVIKTSLDLALDELPAESPARSDLDEAVRAADSAARLTQQLLAFSRKQVIAPRELDLNEVVHRVAAMLQRLLGEDITLCTSTAPHLGLVRFDPGQAEQVLVNLAVNARDAMPRGGTLRLETSNLVVSEALRRRHPGMLAGEHILLTVSDTGTGMSPEVLAHAFEPFFTTKPQGEGTGLGLAVIHGAVTQNGGQIEVTSAPGAGTTFRIYLPRITPPVVSPVLPPPVEAPRGHETVVLVEDDSGVRTLMSRLLTMQGYQVIAFDSGPHALEWMAGSKDVAHLLLTDVIMPKMNGRELADAVHHLRPQMRVLYASGYTDNVIAQHGVLAPDVPFLGKPFSAQELAIRVRAVLDADAPVVV